LAVELQNSIYKLTTTAAASFGIGNFAIWSTKPSYQNTFSDWEGPVSGWFGSYGPVSVTKQSSTSYGTFGIGFGWGLSLPQRGTGGWIQGKTILIGKPYYYDPVNHEDGDF